MSWKINLTIAHNKPNNKQIFKNYLIVEEKSNKLENNVSSWMDL
jgi:hypothetical protein